MKSSSQASQDIFVLKILNEKRNGTFLEIGSNHPICSNNSYVMETTYGWKGLMVEYDGNWAPLYDQHRSSKYIINDARNINYREFLDNNFPSNIDYLQIDLDVNNRSTLDVLEKLESTVFDKYKFATVTFEHDIYTGNFFDTRAKSREIFSKAGYVLVFPDVKVDALGNGVYVPFEDWYVHPDLVDMSRVDKVKSKTHHEIASIMKSI